MFGVARLIRRAFSTRRARQSTGPTRSQRGFTLIELVVAIGVTGILSSLIVSTNFLLQKTDRSSGAQIAVSVEVQKATRWLTRDIRKASSTTVVDDPGAPPVSSAEFMWVNAEGEHNCAYELSGTDLVRACDSGTLVVGRNISNLEFSRSGRLVTVSFTATSPNGSLSETVSMHVSMRTGG